MPARQSDITLRVLGTRETVAEIAAIDTTILYSGAQVFVEEDESIWLLLKSSSATPDGTNIVASATGSPGRWFRQSSGIASHVHFGHMSFATTTPFVIAGSGAGAVELHDNSPGSPQYQGPTPASLNNGFVIDDTLSPIKRLVWVGQHVLNAMVFYYGTFEISGGGIALTELSLARDGVQEASSSIIVELSGNRPQFFSDTTLIQMQPGEGLSPMIQNIGTAVNVEAFSGHLSISGAVDL